MTLSSAQAKSRLAPLRAAMRDFSEAEVKSHLDDLLAPDAQVHLSHPFGDMAGDAFFEKAYAPLLNALPDLERRDFLVVAGTDSDGHLWVGCGGHYMGTFIAPFLDIPPTGHIAHMRYHEFFRFDGDQVAEIQAIWDVPELMIQAGAWPMAPSLGREGLMPTPLTQDGLSDHDESLSDKSQAIVIDMLTHLSRHPSAGGPEIMQAERFWHPRMNWYGPAGIGAARGIAGFRHWHQIPFLKAMPDRKGGTSGQFSSHFFADGPYVAVTGWPNMEMTLTGDGWLGIPPTGQAITMRSLDFWRIEGDLIRENWVLVDLLDVYRQLGIDVFARLREFNKARVPGRSAFPIGATL